MNRRWIMAVGVLAGVCLASNATSSLAPLIEKGKEFGYVQYTNRIEDNPNPFVKFYRLIFTYDQEIEGKNYTYPGIHTKFKTGVNYSQTGTFMREEDGKVYVRYQNLTNTDVYFYSPEYAEGYSPEYLLYDFNMEVGDSFIVNPPAGIDKQPIVVKCIETGQIETGEGSRKYLKFDSNADESTSKWMAFDTLIEGIGPVGDCDMTNPFKLHDGEANGDNPATIDMLYKRDAVYIYDDGYQRMQGVWLWLSPLFEVKGIYDPSIWYWPRADYKYALSDVKEVKLPESETSCRMDNGELKVSSANEAIKEVRIFDLTGKMLGYYQPNKPAFSIPVNTLNGKIVVVRISTTTGSKTFKVML